MQEGKQGGEDQRVVVRSRLARNLASMTLNPFPTEPSLSSSHSPSNLRAKFPTLDSLSTAKLAAMDSNENSASSSQVWHTDSVPNSGMEKPVARSKQSTIGQHLILDNLSISPHCVGYMDEVFAYVRHKLGRPSEDKNRTDQHQSNDL